MSWWPCPFASVSRRGLLAPRDGTIRLVFGISQRERVGVVYASRRREVHKHPPSSSLTRGRKGRSSTRSLPPRQASCRSRATAVKRFNPSSPLAAISVTRFRLLQRKHLRRDFKGNDMSYFDEFSVEQTYDMGYSSFVCTVARRNNQRRPP